MRCGATDQLHDYFQFSERLSAPVLGDVAKETMFDFIPFAGSRREVTNVYRQARLVSKVLQRDFPEFASVCIAAAAVCCDKHLASIRKSLASHFSPPSQNCFHCKIRGIVVDADTDPSFIVRQIVHAVGNGFTEFGILKVVYSHFQLFTGRPPFTADVAEIPDQFLLFRVHRDHRLASTLQCLDATVDVFKLGVAVAMVCSFASFAVGLQAVTQFVQQVSHLLPSDAKPLPVELSRQTLQLRQVQRIGYCGSPRDVGSTSASNAIFKCGCDSLSDLRPAPELLTRTYPSGFPPAFSSPRPV